METSIATACYGMTRKLMAVILAGVVIVFVGAVIANEGLAESRSIYSNAFLAMILGFPALALVLEVFFVRVDVRNNTIICRSPWRRDRVIPMTDVTGVDFSIWAQWFRIHTQSNGTIRLHRYLLGRYDVLQAVASAGHAFPRVQNLK